MAENLARLYHISRATQDQYALRSQERRAQVAIESDRFADEILALDLKGAKGKTSLFARDEHYRANTTIED